MGRRLTISAGAAVFVALAGLDLSLTDIKSNVLAYSLLIVGAAFLLLCLLIAAVRWACVRPRLEAAHPIARFEDVGNTGGINARLWFVPIFNSANRGGLQATASDVVARLEAIRLDGPPPYRGKAVGA